MRIAQFSLLLLLTTLFGQAQASDQDIQQKLNALKAHPTQLYRFLHQMPKGADLHNHFAGATYAEALLNDARHEPYCIAPPAYEAKRSLHCKAGYSLDAILQSPQKKHAVLAAWSMADFKQNGESGHDHFFASFNKFYALVATHRGKILAEIKQRAANQHEQYLELMITPDDNQSGMMGSHLKRNLSFKQMQDRLRAMGIERLLKETQAKMDDMQAKTNRILRCDKNASSACKLKVRYLYQVLREQAPSQVFSQLLLGFMLTKQDPRFVGINMVMPEDGKIAIRDYKLHMDMVRFLRKQFPNTHISLHAGELTKALTAPKNLENHIQEAITIAGAERIGHGVDIRNEKNYRQLLKLMAKKHILVEINLSSNRAILRIAKGQHPFSLYQKFGVPTALSTDDAAILRINLTHEYLTAVRWFNLDYETLKRLNRNSLSYSFLPGESLWMPDNRVHRACRKEALGSDKPSRSCRHLLQVSEKAALQWQLEARLHSFEQQVLAS